MQAKGVAGRARNQAVPRGREAAADVAAGGQQRPRAGCGGGQEVHRLLALRLEQ